MKRILLFVATNLAIVVTLNIVLGLLGVAGYLRPDGVDYGALAVFCLVWGMGGAFISLQLSRWIAKRAMGVELVDGRSGDPQADWLYRTVERLTQQAVSRQLVTASSTNSATPRRQCSRSTSRIR